MLSGGRWHTRGIPVVYAADSPALALLETMVHLEDAELLSFSYLAIRIRFTSEHLLRIEEDELPKNWKLWPWPRETQQLGTRWFDSKRSVVLRVPSAVVAVQSNYLINPTHPDFGELEIGSPKPFEMDARLGLGGKGAAR